MSKIKLEVQEALNNSVEAIKPLHEIKVRKNVRDTWNGNDLVPSILSVGLTDAPLLEYTGEIVRGHRRFDALQQIQEKHSNFFLDEFKNGIPVKILPKDTPQHVINILKVDQGNTLPLKSNIEKLNAVEMLSKTGLTETEILIQLYDILGISEAKERELHEHKTKSFEQALLDHKKGWLRDRLWILKMPDVVKKGYENYERGREGLQIKMSETKALWNAFQEDKKDKEHNYGKTNPGPRFNEALEALKEAHKNGKVITKPKMMTKTQVEAIHDKSGSKTFVALTQKILGKGNDTTNAYVLSMEKHIEYLEAIMEYDEKWFKNTFIPKGKEAKEKLLEAQMA